MTPSQFAFHQAHLARKNRIAEASIDLVRRREMAQRRSLDANIKPLARREYETPKRVGHFQTITSRILNAVADEFGITATEMTGSKRNGVNCMARFVAVGIMIEMTHLSFPAIGKRLGGRDHTTILHARNRAVELFANEAFRNRVDQIKQQVQA